MKQCGEKWQAAKAAGTSAGTTWPKFLADCRSGKATEARSPDAKASDAAMKAESSGPSAVKADAKEGDKTAKAATAAPQPKGKITFPAAIAAKHASLRPSQARQKTCSEQYRANKPEGANGGLRWLEKGGGYWSLCNARLKS